MESLTRLVLAWAPVALWFVVATAGIARWVDARSQPQGDDAAQRALPVRLLKWRVVEAGLLTLFGSLWFDTLGTGAWWLVFLLVGAIATIPTWLALHPGDHRPTAASLVAAVADLARYLLAGAILAWRLG